MRCQEFCGEAAGGWVGLLFRVLAEDLTHHELLRLGSRILFAIELFGRRDWSFWQVRAFYCVFFGAAFGGEVV